MGQNDIINKIKKFLIQHNPLTEEAHSVYLMVEIRKVIEQENNNDYPLLKFYCDWCVHSKKDKITRQMKEMLQNIYKDMLLRKTDEENLEISDFVEMEGLRKEMASFLIKYSLPKSLKIRSNGWKNFTKFFRMVLIDQPIDNSYDNPYDKIKSFAFTQETPGNTAKIKIVYENKPAEYVTFTEERGQVIAGHAQR